MVRISEITLRNKAIENGKMHAHSYLIDDEYFLNKA